MKKRLAVCVSASSSQAKNRARRLLVEEEEQQHGPSMPRKKGLEHLRKARQEPIPDTYI